MVNKMNCFFFKWKKGSKPVPESQNESKKKNPGLNRAVRSTSSLPSPRTITELYKEKEHNLRVFTLQELKEATNGFNRMLKIGEGGFGSVYKGTIKPQDGRGDPVVVAIKCLNTRGFQVYLCFHSFVLASLLSLFFFLN